MPQNKLISQKDFASRLREQLPELADFNDSQIVSKVLELRPELTSKIENPLSGDAAASVAQDKATKDSRSLVKQDTWANHPHVRDFAQSVMQALPGTGSILGGMAATPETLGGGTILGASLGAGIGRGAMDIGNQLLGLGDTSPMEKARNIGMDAGTTAVMPGLMTAARYPIKSARMLAGAASNLEDNTIPTGLNKFVKMPWMDKFAKGGNEVDPLVRPRGNNLGNIADEVIQPVGSVTKPSGTLDVNNPIKLKIRLDANGKFINTQTGEEISPLEIKNEFTPWKGAKDIANKLLPAEKSNLQSITTKPEVSVRPQFNPKNQVGKTGTIQRTIDNAPPNQRARMFRGAHDPVDILFEDASSRETFGAGKSLFTKGYPNPDAAKQLSYISDKIAKQYNLTPIKAGQYIRDYNQEIRRLGSALPKQGDNLSFKAPSFESFIKGK